MAKYNTFVVYDCKKRRNLLVTSSARKAEAELVKGFKVEVWNENAHIETVYYNHVERIDKYIEAEKRYIAEKQKRATERNKQRRSRSNVV